jgi:hypothetical protein
MRCLTGAEVVDVLAWSLPDRLCHKSAESVHNSLDKIQSLNYSFCTIKSTNLIDFIIQSGLGSVAIMPASS